MLFVPTDAPRDASQQVILFVRGAIRAIEPDGVRAVLLVNLGQPRRRLLQRLFPGGRLGRLGIAELEDALEHQSGLLGLSGLSGRVEELEASRTAEARLALGVFSRRVAGAVAAMAASLAGLDALVFTGGVGEHSSSIRAAVCARLGFAGVELDAARNAEARADADIAAPRSRVKVAVIAAREDVVAARAARALLG